MKLATEELVPLHSLEMEMSVLGSCMLDTSAYKEIAYLLTPDSFYRPCHQEIYRTIQALATQKKPTSLEFVLELLTRRDRLKDIGGEDLVIQIADYVPSPANAHYYAGIVAEYAEKRGYRDKASRLVVAADNGGELEDLRKAAKDVALAPNFDTGFVDIGEVDISKDDVGIPTGIKAIDDAISTKGAPIGNSTVVSAYHKAGKSSLMVQISAHVAGKLGMRVLYATFADLNAVRLKKRLCRCVCGWSKYPESMMMDKEAEDFRRTLEDMSKVWDYEIFDAVKARCRTVEDFAHRVESKHMKRPYDAIFVDYGQRIKSDKARHSSGPEGDIVSQELSELAALLNVALFVGSQITEGKDQKTITKGSRGWEEDAGLVLRVKREEQDRNEMEIEIPYSRFGGDGTFVKGRWNDTNLTFDQYPVQIKKK